jgi:hypothetical protein
VIFLNNPLTSPLTSPPTNPVFRLQLRCRYVKINGATSWIEPQM